MQETHPLRVFPDGGDEHVTSNLKVDSSGSRRTQTGKAGIEPATTRNDINTFTITS
ncbi:hypothetical protein [Bifidobacterium longum]|uniref:hypothetical protein n=1 Tax=Bifidobacterium longum TaxID=216816 RepID=UPI0015BE0428|nr:hypothetical protein [Bifidobacterium longum]